MIARHVAIPSWIHGAKRPIHVITGPRSTGKTHLAQTLYPTHRHVALSLPSECDLAERDPSTFLSRHPPPVVIDDAHRALGLVRHVAAALTGHAPPAHYVLVGARPRALAEAAHSACGTAVAVLELPGLSPAEVAGACPDVSLAGRLIRGGFPALYAAPARDVREYLRALVADHLHRELPCQLRVDSPTDFERFLRAVALRSGRVLNKAALAREIGIAGSTAAIWLDTLVEAGIVALLRPWQPAQGRAPVKAPKLYFRDTGLCGYLLGIRSEDDLAVSPLAGVLWETCVHAEIRRLAAALGPTCEPVSWRDRTKEADFVVPTARGFVVCDAAWTEFPAAADLRRLVRIRTELGPERVAALAVVCRTPHTQRLREPAGPLVETIGLEDLPGLIA